MFPVAEYGPQKNNCNQHLIVFPKHVELHIAFIAGFKHPQLGGLSFPLVPRFSTPGPASGQLAVNVGNSENYKERVDGGAWSREGAAAPCPTSNCP